MQRGPCLFIDFGFQRRLEGFVRIIRAQEIRVAHKKASFVVIRVDEPAGNLIRPVAADFAGARMKHIHPVHLHLEPTVSCIENLNVRLTEDNKQIALAGVLQVFRHVQIGVHASL